MKTLPLLALCAATLCGPAAFAQSADSDYVPVKVNQTEDATYPAEARQLDIKSGAASIAVAIDDKGNLTDALVTAYTYPAFADQALKVLKKWTFEPARIRGEALSSKADLTFSFELKGVAVVSMDIISDSELMTYKLREGREVYSACSLAQLDRIPNPKKIVKPAYAKQTALASRGGRVEVEFYIDQDGHVRMPSVKPDVIEESGDLAVAAVNAVSQWQFEQPVSKGLPVLVLAHQSFDFKPVDN
jgi:TonB family protein